MNPARLAEEAASRQQRAAQRYVDEVPAPSVITLNAVAAARGVNQYLFATVELQELPEEVYWLKFRPIGAEPTVELPRQGSGCSECQGRLGSGRLQELSVRTT